MDVVETPSRRSATHHFLRHRCQTAGRLAQILHARTTRGRLDRNTCLAYTAGTNARARSQSISAPQG
eukprot:7183537-Pyramimonas_sp.AAC.2